jgi:UDP-N-acetylglucosamine 2-epimerase
MKVATIIGARPQFIKAGALSRTFVNHNLGDPSASIQEILVHTGQHYDDEMSAIFFRELEIPEPQYNLNIGSGSHGQQTGRMLMALEEVLLREKPDWVLVYGDTNSTLAGVLAAAKLHLPIAHVEAGLRSFNRLMPEEINRVVADHLAALLLCPSQMAVDNLALEGISKGVFLTGDVMADALQFAEEKSADSTILKRLGLQPKGYLLTTVHRPENTDKRERLDHIIAALGALDETVVFPVHPRTRKLLQANGYKISRNVHLIEPVGYLDSIALQKSARILMTDSGGMQKEAYWLRVPCITLRDQTEWVETVESGWNVLTGADRKRIVEAVLTAKEPSSYSALYGDGRAAERIIDRLAKQVSLG